VTDSFEKRGKKGYLFTVGDENPTPRLRAQDLEKVEDHKPQKDYTPKELIKLASKQWEIFHLIVLEGDHCRNSHNRSKVIENWKGMLGQRAILLEDHTKMAEVIISTMQIHEGKDAKDVASAWNNPDIAKVVSSALGKYNRKLDLEF
jgi:hypothetical protein